MCDYRARRKTLPRESMPEPFPTRIRSRVIAPQRIARIAAAIALAWLTLELMMAVRRGRQAWPPPARALEAHARALGGGKPLVAVWERQLEHSKPLLLALRAALRAEPNKAKRLEVARSTLELLDSGRREDGLRATAGLKPKARIMAYARRLHPAVAGTRANPTTLGEPLGRLARQRQIDRATHPHRSHVLDEFRRELMLWLVPFRQGPPSCGK